jgi:hypothetical protein
MIDGASREWTYEAITESVYRMGGARGQRRAPGAAEGEKFGADADQRK